MASIRASVEVTITNREAVKAFREAFDTLGYISRDQSWNQDLRTVVKKLRRAARGMKVNLKRKSK